MRVSLRSRRRRKDQQGAVALMVAFSMLALCVAAAFVIDFGLLRVDRQQNKSAADAAAASGANALILNSNQPLFYPFAGVCSALDYLQVNSPDFTTFDDELWTDGTGTGVSDPCAPDRLDDVCIPNTPTTWARFTGATDAGIAVQIQSGYEVNDGTWVEDDLPSLQADPGSSTQGGCDQIAVTVSQVRDTTLGSLAVEKIGSGLRSVARVNVLPPKTPIALLILERTDCQALAVSSTGAGARIDVSGEGQNPGLIHVDSDGTGQFCNKPIIEGKNSGVCPDPSPATDPPTYTCGGIVAHEAKVGGEPGYITVVAATNTSDGIPKVYAGPAPGTGPSRSDLVTRQIVDDIYLKGVTQAATDANFAWDAAANGTPPSVGGWKEVGCPDGVVDVQESGVPVTKYFVKCSAVIKNASFPNATDVIFTGTVDKNVRLPKAERVYVVGGTSPGAITGDFFMRDGGNPCPVGGTLASGDRRGRLMVLNGDIKVSGAFRACQTSVILLGGDREGCLPELSPYAAIQTKTPCPSGAGSGFLTFSGNANVEITAPNKTTSAGVSTDYDDLEDLNFWAESYGGMGVAGGGSTGSVVMAGVFMAPNADPLKLNGGSSQNVRNSQYIVRKLWNTGNGRLEMAPLSSLPIQRPVFAVSLVR